MKLSVLLERLNNIKSSEDYVSFPSDAQTQIDAIITILTEPITDPVSAANKIQDIVTQLRTSTLDVPATDLYPLLMELVGNHWRSEFISDISTINQAQHASSSIRTEEKSHPKDISQPNWDFLKSVIEHEGASNEPSQELAEEIMKAKKTLDAWLESNEFEINNNKILSKKSKQEVQVADADKILKFYHYIIDHLDPEQKMLDIIDIFQSHFENMDNKKLQDTHEYRLLREIHGDLVTDESPAQRLELFREWIARNNSMFQELRGQVEPYLKQEPTKSQQQAVELKTSIKDKTEPTEAKEKTDQLASLELTRSNIRRNKTKTTPDMSQSQKDKFVAWGVDSNNPRVDQKRRVTTTQVQAQDLKESKAKKLKPSKAQEANEEASRQLATEKLFGTSDPLLLEKKVKKFEPLVEEKTRSLQKQKTNPETDRKEMESLFGEEKVSVPSVTTRLEEYPQDRLDSFALGAISVLDSQLQNNVYTLKQKKDQIDKLFNKFKDYLKNIGITPIFSFSESEENLVAVKLKQNESNSPKYDLSKLEECYNRFDRELQLIKEKLQKEREERAEKDKEFLYMSPNQQLDHLKNLARTIPFKYFESEKNRLLNMLNREQMKALYYATPENTRKLHTINPKIADIPKLLNKALEDFLLEDKWEIWSAQKQLQTDPSATRTKQKTETKVTEPQLEPTSFQEDFNHDKFLLLAIKNEILHMDLKGSFKQKKNLITYQEENDKNELITKKKYLPQYMAKIYNTIVECESKAKAAHTKAEYNEVWANAIRNIASIGNEAYKHRPKSFLGIEIGRGRDPKANALYQKLGDIYQQQATQLNKRYADSLAKRRQKNQ